MVLILLSIFSGITFAFSILSLSVYIMNRKQSLYLYFGGFSLFSSVYFLLLSISKLGVLGLGWAIILSAALYYSIFPWFLFQFKGQRGNSFLWGVSFVFLIAFATYLFEERDGSVAIWQIIAHFGLVTLMITAIYVAVTFEAPTLRIKREFSFLCILFVLLGTEEIVRTYTGHELLTYYMKGIQPLDVYPLLFTFSIGIRLSNDFINRKELEVQQILLELKEKKLELAELESRSLRNEIVFKKKDLKLFGMELNRRSKYGASLIDRMNLLKKKEPIRPVDVDEIIRYAKSQLRIDQNMEYFQSNIEDLNHEFISNLKKNYPNLTENELHLSSLLRLRLNTKEIANIKSISPDSVKVLRYRLRKKFNLSKEINLVEFLQDF